MNISDLKRLLDVQADADSDGEALVLLASNGEAFSVSYKLQGSSVTTSLPYKGKKFLVKVDLLAVQCAIADCKSSDEVKFAEQQGDLIISIFKEQEKIKSLKIDSSLKLEVAVSPDDFIAEHEAIEFTGKQWKLVDQVAGIMFNHQSQVDGLEVFISGTNVTVKGLASEFICQRTLQLDKPVAMQRFILPIKIIDLAGIFKPSTVKIRSNSRQILLEVGDTIIVSEPIEAEFPATDGLFERNPQQEVKATVDRKAILEIVQGMSDAGAKKITLIFGDQNITIRGGKQSQSLEASTKNAVQVTISIATNILLAVLGSVNHAKVIFLLPFVGASSLIVEVVSGLMFIVAVAAKKLKEATNALDVAKFEPEKQVLQTGTNSDGSQYTIEAVEQPAVPDGTVEQYSSQLQEIITQVKAQIFSLETNLGGEYLPKGSEQAIARKNQLISLNQRISDLIQEVRSPLQMAEVDESYRLADLQAVELRLQWAYNRALEIAFFREKEWRFHIRLLKTA